MAEQGAEQQAAERTENGITEPTIGQLVARASQDVSEIVRAEVALAKAELVTSAKNGAIGGGMFAVAGYLAFLATILLTIAAAYGVVAAGLRPWLAFLIVAAAFLIIAGIFGLIGRSRVRRVGPPKRAIDSTKTTIAAVKNRR